MFQGAWRFAIVSTLAFGVWAVVGHSISDGALYAGCALAFLIFSHLLMAPLVHQPNRLMRFAKSFNPAFIAYSIVWSAFWFALGFNDGEWLGLIAGCAVFALIVGKTLGAKTGYLPVIAVFIVTHAAGYFLGSYVFDLRKNPPAFLASLSKRDLLKVLQLGWGLCYGLGFGAGIGFAYQRFQTTPVATTPSQSLPPLS